MRNKVRFLGAFLLPALMAAAPGCSKENTASGAGKEEPQSKTIEDRAAEARKLIEAKTRV